MQDKRNDLSGRSWLKAGDPRPPLRRMEMRAAARAAARRDDRRPVALLVLLGIAVALVLVWLVVIPVSLGYHIGFNAATDHYCLSRVLQWCRP
jgi:ferric-dicitrate binding protein FerR (iron transport regulator)